MPPARCLPAVPGLCITGAVEPERTLREIRAAGSVRLARSYVHGPDPQGTTVLSTDGGETRYYVRPGEHGWLVVTRAGRSGPENREIAAASTDVLDRFFLTVFGQVSRGNRRMRLIRLPNKIDELKAGYSVANSDEGTQILVDSDGEKVALAPAGIIGTSTLVKLSHLLGRDIQDAKSIFDAPRR